jgi:hypothetical protein
MGRYAYGVGDEASGIPDPRTLLGMGDIGRARRRPVCDTAVITCQDK